MRPERTTALAHLPAALREGALAPADAARLADAIERYLARAVPTLDAAFGLVRGPGQRDERTMAAIRERDALLQDAAVRFWPNLAQAAQAEQLAIALGRYAASAWLRERVLDQCPVRHAGRVEAVAWQVLRLSDRALSARTVRVILSAK